MATPHPHQFRRVTIASRVAPLKANPAETALLFDVDGTLGPLGLPAGRISNATRDHLRRLAADYRTVAVITGRRALNARDVVGLDCIGYSGNHGLEHLDAGAGSVVIEPAAMAWLAPMRQFVADHQRALEAAGVRIEDKELVVALHWNESRNRRAAYAQAASAADAAARAGLRVITGRGVFEVQPPVALDKGSAVRRVIAADASLHQALYAGDDVTDLDAFAALESLRLRGRLRNGVRVGVSSRQGPRDIVTRADLVVRGPRGVRRVLERL